MACNFFSKIDLEEARGHCWLLCSLLHPCNRLRQRFFTWSYVLVMDPYVPVPNWVALFMEKSESVEHFMNGDAFDATTLGQGDLLDASINETDV